MQPGINKGLIAAKGKVQRKDTAYYLFDKGAQIPYRVSMAHHRMHNGAMNDPMMNQSKDQLDDISKQFVYIQTPVIDAVDYFISGASVDIAPETMDVIYDRIEKHIDAHSVAMRSDPRYYIGDTFEVFEQIVEFAAAIWPRVKGYRDKHKIVSPSDDPMARMLTGRANFMTMLNRQEVKVERKEEGFLRCPLEDKLERMRVYFESSQSWRQ